MMSDLIDDLMVTMANKNVQLSGTCLEMIDFHLMS